MPRLTAGEVARLSGGRVVGDPHAASHAIVGDSREAGQGVAFAAIRGGHAYVGDAIAAGAPYVIVDRSQGLPPGGSVVVTGDVPATLAKLAVTVRQRLNPLVVAITGSVGKTLTKDFTAAALGTRRSVAASPRSFNTEVGVPLTVLASPEDTEVLVVELGARHRGEIAELSAIVRPDVGIVTGIGVTHLGEFGSRDAIARTKAELLTALGADGLAIVPTSDDYLPTLIGATAARLRTVGPGGAVRYRSDGVAFPGTTRGALVVDDTEYSVQLPIAGLPLMRNAAMAVAAAVELGVAASEAVEALERVRPTEWRMEISMLGPWTYVNDAYNANPSSMAAALRTASTLAGDGPVWAVLGHMAELGVLSRFAHERVGRLARALGLDRVIAIGKEAAPIASGAGDIAAVVPDAAAAADLFVDQAPPGAVLIVKGSQVCGLAGFGALVAESTGLRVGGQG